LGVGFINGKAWISLFQNAPTTSAKLDYTVEITGDNVIGKCKYSNGQYCSGDNYSDCNSVAGCTVSSQLSRLFANSTNFSIGFGQLWNHHH
jgi:SUN family beta-glucosidase